MREVDTMPYQAQDKPAPVLNSWKLGAAVRAAEGWLGGPVCRLLLRDLGVDDFRERPVPESWGAVRERSGAQEADPASSLQLPDPLAHRAAAEGPPSVGDYLQAYQDGLSPVAVAESFLELLRRDDALPTPLRAVVTLQEEQLMAAAQESAERWKRGQPLGPLDGVPVGIKDEVDVQGLPTGVGTRFLGQQPAERDAETVSRLRGAGALLLGKLSMHELGIGVTGLNPATGSARNPWGREHITGGSSSGSAAAVAAGWCPLSLGADGGGSIRIPAALCGLVGLKPTFGRVSERGAAPLCWSFAHLGPLALRAADAALAYGILAGKDPEDPMTLSQPAPQLEGWDRRDLKGVRLGIHRPWFEHADPQVVSRCEDTLALWQDRGATLVEVELPDMDAVRLAHLCIIACEIRSTQSQLTKRQRRMLTAETRMNFALADQLSPSDYILAQRWRNGLTESFRSLYRDIDVLCSPSTACPAPQRPEVSFRTGESDLALLQRLMRFVVPANLTGFPAISIPAGLSEQGMPIGIHGMGAPWSEALLLRLAAVTQEEHPPALPAGSLSPLHHALGRAR